MVVPMPVVATEEQFLYIREEEMVNGRREGGNVTSPESAFWGF